MHIGLNPSLFRSFLGDSDMILPNSSDLADFPGLVPWLVDGSWRVGFTEEALEHATKVSVPSVAINDNTEHCDILIDSQVQVSGGLDLPVRLLLKYYYDQKTRKQGIRATTECPCDQEGNCEHAAAVLETLSDIANGTPQRQTRNLKPLDTTSIAPAISDWLQQMMGAVEDPSQAGEKAKPYHRFLAYCIEMRPTSFGSDRESFHLSLRVGNHKANGFKIESATVKADPTKPTKYMASDDLLICTRFHARTRKHHKWGSSVPLEGTDWEDILIPAIATGRIFFGTEPEYFRSHLDYHKLSEGPPLTVEPAWEMQADGAAQPTLKLPTSGLKLIPTDPLRYLDAEKHQLGLLQSHLPQAMLVAWVNGPVIAPHEVAILGQELAALPVENPLPVPDEKPATTLTGLTPIPHLHITEIKVGPFLKRHIAGVPGFRYPGCPPVSPLAADAPANNSWLDGNERLILERDRSVETALAAQLEKHGLTPLRRLVSEYDLNDKNRHSVVLHNPESPASEWLEFVESAEFKALAEMDWQIELDPKLGLVVHDIDEFFPTIEEDSGKKIDWFHFDVTGEFEGKRISLIPQIARAIRDDWHLRFADPADIPETILLPCDRPEDGHIRFPAKRFLEMLEHVRHLFHGEIGHEGPIPIDRLGAAGIADALAIDSSETTRTLADLGRNLRNIGGLPATETPTSIKADLRHYQLEGFRWLQFLSNHGLHGILADDMGLGKTLQTLAHLVVEHEKPSGKPSLVIAPTSVVPNWEAETAKFAPGLKILVLHGSDRAARYDQIPKVDVVFTSYPLLGRDIDILSFQAWHVVVLDEAQYIKNPKALTARNACRLKAEQRLCLSGTPMENHLGELWSLMRFLMPGYLADEKTFTQNIRRPIERDHNPEVQLALNRRVSPLILRRTKDQVATELPEKTTIIHRIALSPEQSDLYEALRASMDKRVRDAVAAKGLAKSHIIVLDALLKLRQICCHPQLLDHEDAQRITESAKLEHLSNELLPTLIEEGRRILLFSQFTSMLELIEEHLQREQIPYLKLTGKTKERAKLVKEFQNGTAPVFLISLKAGGTGLNLTGADTVIHYDPWWNPAAENQATDRAHRIGQTKPVFVHKLVCSGTIEERILLLQNRKAALVKALLSEETTRLKIDSETLSQLLAPLKPSE